MGMAKQRKPVAERSKDRVGVTGVNLRVPDNLLAAFDARLVTLNADPTAPQWTRTSLILNTMAAAAKGWPPTPAPAAAEGPTDEEMMADFFADPSA